MKLFSRRVSSDDVAEAVKNAVADATNAITLATHMAQCERDKAEMKADMLRHENARQKMHEENSARFTAIAEQNSQIMRFVWYVGGIAAALSFIFSSFGHDLLTKWIH